jgi:hypothetical protein
MRRKLVIAVCALLGFSCADNGNSDSPSGPDSDAVCKAGDTRICVGPAACEGGQRCGVMGWGVCDCGVSGTTPNINSSTGAETPVEPSQMPDATSTDSGASAVVPPTSSLPIGASAPMLTEGLQWLAPFGGEIEGLGLTDTWVHPTGIVFATGLTEIAVGGEPHFGGFDLLVSTYLDGERLWVRQLGTEGDDWGGEVALDAADNVWVTGSSRGSLAADLRGIEDVVVAKLDLFGMPQWVVQFGTDGAEFGADLAFAPDDGAWVAGVTSGQLGDVAFGSNDVFATHVSSLGEVLTTVQVGTMTANQLGGISVAIGGNVAIAWRAHEGTASWGVVSVFEPTGSPLWEHEVHWAFESRARAVTWDRDENLYVVGGGRDEGADSVTESLYATKFDALGNEVWTKEILPNALEQAPRLHVDTQGRVFVTIMDPEPGVLAFDAGTGDVLWRSGESSIRTAIALTVSNDGALLVSGGTSSGLEVGLERIVLDHP